MHATEHSDYFDFSGLTVTERIDLAQKLLESVRDRIEAVPLTPTEIVEIRSRIAAIDSGFMVCEPFDAVMARAAGR